MSSETVSRYKSKSMKESVTAMQVLPDKASDWPLRHLRNKINPLNAELNPICHLLALLGAHLIFHVSRIRVNVVRTHALKARVVAEGIEYNIIWVRAPKDPVHVGPLLTEVIAAKIRKLEARGKR